jgi:hypothetical protein
MYASFLVHVAYLSAWYPYVLREEFLRGTGDYKHIYIIWKMLTAIGFWVMIRGR